MKSDKKVHILLTTYNGAQYIDAQLGSLLNQGYTNWELIIRDDGSSDDTVDIISNYVNSDGRITFLKDDFGNLKSCQSFSRLMDYVKPMADYVMFCDQDDIWLPDKIEKSIGEMLEMEQQSGERTSLMVYGTYQLIDRDGKLISVPTPVFVHKPSMGLLIAENYVYGCTAIINKHLLNKAAPIPLSAENHDYWVALTALATNGNIAYIGKPLLLYRQHQNNVSGSYRNAFFLNRLRRLLNNEYQKTIRRRMKMFVELHKIYENELSAYNAALLKGYIRYVSNGGIKGLTYCIRRNIHPLNLPQKISYYIGILNVKGDD